MQIVLCINHFTGVRYCLPEQSVSASIAQALQYVFFGVSCSYHFPPSLNSDARFNPLKDPVRQVTF